jgi:hypothetical protein
VPTVLDVDADVVRVLVVARAVGHHYPNRVAATDKTYNIRAPSRFAVRKSKRAFALLPHEFVQLHLVNLAVAWYGATCPARPRRPCCSSCYRSAFATGCQAGGSKAGHKAERNETRLPI